TFTMEGGSIVGNTVSGYGGGVYQWGTFSMNGGNIVDNTTTTRGGGVYNRSGTFSMTGGNIADNTADEDGGGVYNYSDSGTFTMEGGGIKDEIYKFNSTVSIKGGYFGTKAKNSIKSGWLGEGVSIGENDGSNATYPKSDFPYMIGQQVEPYILKTIPNGQPSRITDLKTFNALSSDGATYKLLRNVELVNGTLTVPVTASVTLDLNGFVLKGTGNTGVINNNGKLTIIDSNPTAVHKYSKGSDGLYTWDDTNGTITLKGGAITGGGGVNSTGGTNYKVAGPSYSQIRTTVNYCGGVFNSGTVIINSGNIVGNSTIDGNGGGVTNNGGTFTINGGSIVGNKAKNGGGISNSGNAIMNAGNITNNTSTGNGGAIYNDRNTFTMRGGSITDNKAATGAGVYIGNAATASFTMEDGGLKDAIKNAGSGSVSISGGYFGNAAITSINESWLPEGAKFVNNSGTDAQYSTNDFTTQLDWGYIRVSPPNEESYFVRDLSTFKTLETNNAVYKLLKNVQLLNDLTVPENVTVTLDLNGFVLKGTGSDDVIVNDGNLTITDSFPSAMHKYTVNDDGKYIWDDVYGTITLTGGAITSSSDDNSRGIFNTNVLNMNGGNIVGNSGRDGGGVANGARNMGSNEFAGLAKYRYGTFTMKGGNIVGNTATRCGGGVDSYRNTTFIMVGGSITNNTGYESGGGVYISNGATFTMEGGSITNNFVGKHTDVAASTLNGYGGGVSIDSGTFTMKGGNIVGNTATNGGGGVYISDGTTFTMNDGTIMDNVTLEHVKDGTYNITTGTFTMKNGEVKDAV
ncbi:MAG: hypothetical protein J6Q42_00120, partial [Clostridia bacterium]|nr:hypothetical protein [Clostridia bacterium]